MRSVNDYVADLEADRFERERELRVLLSFLPDDRNSDEGRPIRRSLVLVIYSHVEGFVRFALSAYIEAVNARSLEFRAASIEIAAASATDIFTALANPQKKANIFRRALPDDSALHRVARQQEFVREYEGLIGARVVRLGEKMLNFESNLSADVFRRNLFMIGLDPGLADEHGGTINRLLHVRNGVAHGDRISNPKIEFIEEQMAMALGVMEALQGEIQAALLDEIFRRQPAHAA